MIVYSWKQFWNDFNNWDEGLFQDANRPRDNDKFKIKPWLQSDKWDFRSSNKNISTKTSELIVEQAITAPSGTIYYLPPSLNEVEKVWDPWCIVNKNWKIEIVEDGTYIVQAYCRFRFNSTPANWYQYIENVALFKLNPKTWWWIFKSKNQWRVCANNSEHYDQLTAIYSWWLTKWEVYTVWGCHTYSSTITVLEWLSIQRLA